jgi:hypothetical protein
MRSEDVEERCARRPMNRDKKQQVSNLTKSRVLSGFSEHERGVSWLLSDLSDCPPRLDESIALMFDCRTEICRAVFRVLHAMPVLIGKALESVHLRE